MKISKWIDYDEAILLRSSIGGLGGTFLNGMRWKDYIHFYTDRGVLYLEALRTSILKNNYRFTGRQHQDDPNCCPLFDDGTVDGFTWRGWGDLMAAIWSTQENKDYNYMEFYS